MDFQWPTEDRRVLDIETLNLLSNKEFCNVLFEYRILITMDQPNLYWKHDINNGILMPLQLNSLLSSEKYILINKMRDRLWIENKTHINTDELKNVFGLE